MKASAASHKVCLSHFCYGSILLQKSKVASVRIFGETLKREAIDDSDNLSRVTEVANEFIVRRCGPSGFYTKTAPTALRIFDTFSKTTFATLSVKNGPDGRETPLPLCPNQRTSTDLPGMSQRCHKRTHAPQQTA
jgi:endonuclease III-like uncharacterized protein